MHNIQQTHTTILEINKAALQHNIQVIRKTLKNTSCKIMAIIKANAYGHGFYPISKILEEEKIDCLGVAFSDAGVRLRSYGITIPIVILDTEKEGFENIVQYQLEPVFFNFSLLRSFCSLLQQKNICHFPIHIEIESGMHRLGFEKEQWVELINFLKDKNIQKHIFVKSFFSHLAASDETVHDNYTFQQNENFEKFIALCNLHHLPKTYDTHIANSGATLRFQHLQKNIVRIGVTLLGIELTQPPAGLKIIGTLKTTIAQIKKINQGESIGYSRNFFASHDMTIATVRIGYADGYSRALSNGIGQMFLHGKFAPVVGSICMDICMIDITHIPEAQEEDTVEVFGEHVRIENVAVKINTIPYEILTSISPRIKKVIV